MRLGNRLRRDNLLRVIEEVVRGHQMSRSSLAKILRLDRSTVGQLIDSLIEMGVVEEYSSGPPGPKGGRPPILLRAKKGYGYVIGVEVTFPVLRFIAVDLDQSIVAHNDIRIHSRDGLPMNEIICGVNALRERVAADHTYKGGLIAIGLGVSGLVNPDTDSIELSDAFNIKRPTPISQKLKESTGVPVFVFNDAQACALGELRLRALHNMVFVRIEFRSGREPEHIGVGVACLIDGNLRRGRSVTHLLRPSKEDPPWEEGGSARFVRRLARSLALMGNSLGLRQVVLGGDVEDLFDEIKRLVEELSIRVDQVPHEKPIEVMKSISGLRTVSYGASYAALDQLFQLRQFPLRKESVPQS